MKTSQAGIDLIKKYEGFRGRPYQCSAGVWTIGYGSTYYESGVKVKYNDDQITIARAEQLLANTLAKDFEPAIAKLVKVELAQNEFDALASFVYNLGAANLAGSTLLKKLNAGDKKGAAAEFEKWTKAGGQVLRGLVRRRADERKLFEG